MRKGEAIKKGSEIIGNKTKCKIVKNKVAPPFKEVIFDIMYGEGVSRVGEIIDFAVDLDIIEKSGAWFSYNGERLGQGRDKVKALLQENEALCEEIAQKIREHQQEAMDIASQNAAKARTNEPKAEAEEAPMPTEAPAPDSKGMFLDIDPDDDDFE